MRRFLFLSTIYLLLFTPAFAQSVDILWQGGSYVPPFYKGRTLWSNQSRITLLAVPQGLGNTPSLDYRWSQNGTVLGTSSGVGKNTLSFSDSVLSKSQAIKAEIVSGEGDLLAENSIVVSPVSPSLLVYEKNPLYGYLFHEESSSLYTLKEPEVTFSAFPFFFSNNNRNSSSLIYKWQTNSGEVENKNSVTYRTPETSSGTSAIYASVSNKDKILQSASKSFLIQFGNDQ